MSDYLLDTNILRYWYDTRCDEHANILRHVEAARRPDPQTGYISRLFISVVTLGEIEFGHRVAEVPDEKKQAEYMAFVREQGPERLEIVTHVGERYGQLKAWLFNNCSPNWMRRRAKRLSQLEYPVPAEELGANENDLWIAAQAIAHRFVLVTHDSRGNFGKLLHHFSETLGMLGVQDWGR